MLVLNYCVGLLLDFSINFFVFFVCLEGAYVTGLASGRERDVLVVFPIKFFV